MLLFAQTVYTTVLAVLEVNAAPKMSLLEAGIKVSRTKIDYEVLG